MEKLLLTNPPGHCLQMGGGYAIKHCGLSPVVWFSPSPPPPSSATSSYSALCLPPCWFPGGGDSWDGWLSKLSFAINFDVCIVVKDDNCFCGLFWFVLHFLDLCL